MLTHRTFLLASRRKAILNKIIVTDLCPQLTKELANIVSNMKQYWPTTAVAINPTKNSSQSRHRIREFRVLRSAEIFGQHHALHCGVSFTGHEVIMILDDALQHSMSQVPLLPEILCGLM